MDDGDKDETSHEEEEVEVICYKNFANTGAYYEVAKEEIHPGMCLEGIMDHFDTLSKLGEFSSGDPYSYSEAVVKNLGDAIEMIAKQELTIVNTWQTPRLGW